MPVMSRVKTTENQVETTEKQAKMTARLKLQI